MDNLFEDYMAARCTIKALKRTIEEFKSGERYRKLQKDYHRVTNGYIKEIRKLKLEIGHLNARMISIRNMWSDDYYSMYEEKQAEIRNLKETIRRLEDKIWEERRNSDEKNIKLTLEYEDRLHEKDCIIDELTNRLAHAEVLLASDGSNTSLPTSKTPIGKKKRIPNTREKSGRKKADSLVIKSMSLRNRTNPTSLMSPGMVQKRMVFYAPGVTGISSFRPGNVT